MIATLFRFFVGLSPVEAFALEVVLKATLALMAAWAATAVMRRASAAARELVWRTAFLAVLILPIMMLALPSWRVVLPFSAPAPAAEPLSLLEPRTEVPAAPADRAHPSAVAPSGTDGRGSGNPAPSPEAPTRVTWRTAGDLVWILGAAAFAIPLLLGRRRLRMLLSRSLPPADGDRAAVADVAAALGVRSAPKLASSDEVDLPITAGFLFEEPVIVLPAGFRAWAAPRRLAVLWHEVAHVKRRDALVQTLARWISVALWPIPFVWLALRRLGLEAELAADEIALGSGLRPSDYASELVGVAAEVRGETLGAAIPGMAFGNSALRRRVVAVLATASRHPRATGRLGKSVIAGCSLATVAVLAGLACSFSSAGGGAEPSGAGAVGFGVALDRAAAESARDRGLAWLAKKQDAKSGGWMEDVGYKFNLSYLVTVKAVPHAGVTALAVMAFLDAGARPDRGEHAGVVSKAAVWLAKRSQDNGGYLGTSGERMYSHALGVWCLARLREAGGSDDVGRALKQAAQFTIAAQGKGGAWRYEPNSEEADSINTSFQVVALQAARKAGITVDPAIEERAKQYLVSCVVTKPGNPDRGAVAYQAREATRASVGSTAATLVALLGSAQRDWALLDPAFAYLTDRLPVLSKEHTGHYFWWHGNLFAMHAFKAAAALAPDRYATKVEEQRRRVVAELIESQQTDGSWKNSVGPGAAFSTAVACLLLGY